MKCKIIYLKPQTGFKTELRSDTLFNTLCWGIRMIHGNEALESLFRSYLGENKRGDEAPFYLSSTFPYQVFDGEKVPFLPNPFRLAEKPTTGSSFLENRLFQRLHKADRKNQYLDLHNFKQLVERGAVETEQEGTPAIKDFPSTHNSINRITGSTLNLPTGGQLFHINEYYVDPFLKDEDRKNPKHPQPETGLYFLVSGNTAILEAPLRLLSHIGIGGGRTKGKGRFDISFEDEIHIQEADDANAFVTLSLYHPKESEALYYQEYDEPTALPLYKTEVRTGVGGFLNRGPMKKKAHYFFQEGSVFPIPRDGSSNPPYGKLIKNIAKNPDAKDHRLYHYGYAFTVKIKR